MHQNWFPDEKITSCATNSLSQALERKEKLYSTWINTQTKMKNTLCQDTCMFSSLQVHMEINSKSETCIYVGWKITRNQFI